MLKFDFELDLDIDELSKGIEKRLNAAVARTANDTRNEALKIASQLLRSGLEKWTRGLIMDKVEDGVYVVSIVGKLAHMMEEGFSSQEFKNMILGGNRFKHNKSQGKNYVDIPLTKTPSQGGQISSGKSQVNISKFKDSSELIKQIEVSDYKKGGTRQEKRAVTRIKDIIRNRNVEAKQPTKAAFITIRRFTPESEWSGYKGAKVLDSNRLHNLIEKSFEINLKELI